MIRRLVWYSGNLVNPRANVLLVDFVVDQLSEVFSHSKHKPLPEAQLLLDTHLNIGLNAPKRSRIVFQKHPFSVSFRGG